MNITIATLRAAGLSEAQILKVVEIADTEAVLKNREQNRIRQRNHRARNACHSDTRDEGSPSLLDQPLTVVQERKVEIVALASEFAEFYAAYPHKVGKRAAATAFERARRRAPMDQLMVGLARYAGKTDDRPWCNPATWLNQDRWEDQVGPSQEGNGKPGVAQATIEQRERELRQRLHAQGASPYEIEQEVRRSAGLGTERPSNIAQLRPALGVVRSENQNVERQLAFPKQ